MILKLKDAFADEIVRHNLMDNYIRLKAELKTKKDIHEDDIVAYKKVVKAIEVLGTWYFTDFEGDVKEYKKLMEENK